MSASLPPGKPNPSGRNAILGLAAVAVVFFAALIGASVWVVRHFVKATQEVIVIPQTAAPPQNVTVAPAAAAPAAALVAPAVAPRQNAPANTARARGARGPANSPVIPRDQAIAIGGVVHDEAGNPVAGVNVMINYTTKIQPTGFRGQSRPGMLFGANETARTSSEGQWTTDNIANDAATSNNFRIRLVAADYADTPITSIPFDKLQDQSAVFVITRGVDISGTVTDDTGQPVVAARIFTHALNRNPNSSGAADATSGADGKFVIHRIAPGQALPVVAMKTGWTPASANVVVSTAGNSVALKLSHGRDVTGRVVDRNGTPVSGVSVALYEWNNQYQPFNLTAISDADGNYTLHSAADDEFEIQADKAGYVGGGLTQVPAGGSPRDITMSKQISVKGTVVDATTHEPIASFTVITGVKWNADAVTNFQPGTARPFTNGNFNLALNGFSGEISAWFIRVEAPGYLPAISPPMTDSSTQNIELQPGKDLTGHVYDLSGQPMAGVSVVLATEGEQIQIRDGGLQNSNSRQVTTSADGGYDFPPQAGKFTVLVLASDGYAMVDQDAMARSPDIRLVAYGRIEGKLTSAKPGGQNMALTINQRQPGRQTMYFNWRATTSDDGSFVFDHVPGGDYQVYRVQHTEDPNGQSMDSYVMGVAVTVAAGKTAPVAIGFIGHTISGHVTDKSGKPLAGAEVTGNAFQGDSNINLVARADADGTYVINDAPSTAVLLSAVQEGYLAATAQVGANDTHADFLLPPEPQVHGAVTDATTHEPIGEFHIMIGRVFAGNSSPEFQNGGGGRTTPSFSNGQYQLGLISGTATVTGWVLRVEAKGYAPALSPVLHDSGTQDFALQPGVDLKGAVVDLAGNPAAGATVVLVIGGQQVNINGAAIQFTDGLKVTTGADGSYDFPPQVGKYTVIALSSAGYVKADQDALAASPQLQLAGWGRVEGTVKIGSVAAANARIFIQAGGMGVLEQGQPRIVMNSSATTDANGHFVVEQIPTGKALVSRLVQQTRDGRIMQTMASARSLDVKAGQTTTANIGGDGRPVTGRALLPAGAGELKDWSVSAFAVYMPPDPAQMPDDIKKASVLAKRAWLATFAQTPAGTDYVKKLQESGVMTQQLALDIKDDGTFRMEDVTPGNYAITVLMRSAQTGIGTITTDAEFTMPAITDDLKAKPLEIADIELKVK